LRQNFLLSSLARLVSMKRQVEIHPRLVEWVSNGTYERFSW
jgi:hypothetical protein